ncbi:MAG: NAD-dependent epimerase/dehydratase family protein [Bacteroidales bacterium]|jgi:dihydroflavonol-4-reductase
MKVLVTGANGFLSGHIINELLKYGYSVRAMMRAGAKAPALTGLDVEVIYGNITDKSAIEKAFEGCKIVIHAAADTNQSYRKIEDYYPANIQSTANIIEAMSGSGCKRLIFVSSANTMGFGTLANPGNETTPASPILLKSGYAKSKFISQNLVVKAVKNQKIDAVVVNPTFIIGPLDYNPRSGKIFKMILGKKIVFYPPGGKNFVDVRDAAKGIVNATNYGKSGECYLIAGENLSFHDFFLKTKLLAKQKTKLVPIPGFILKLAGIFGSVLRYFGMKTDLSLTNARILATNNYFDNSKAVSQLGLSCSGIDKTINDYLNWLNFENKKNHFLS